MIKPANSLVLEISKSSEMLKMSIFEQKDLAQTIRYYSQLTISSCELDKLCNEIVVTLNRTNKRGDLDANSFRSLEKTGQLLWDHLFTKTVKDKLKSTTLKDLVLSLDEDLIGIPWELLYDGKEFLCLKFNLGRLIKTKEQFTPGEYRSASTMPKMLILANPTNDLKSSYLEGVQIKNQFERKKREISIDFKSTQIDTLYVKKNLRDYDIVHFAGHCEYDAFDSKKSGWLLSDGRFSIQDIIALGETLSLPSLVFSNACNSASLAEKPMEIDYQDKTYNLASAFLYSGVRHYIGTIRKIEDSISLFFANEFYSKLVSGKSVGECLRLARLGSIKEYGINSIAWASYLLYGDTNFVMFKQKIPSGKLEIKRKAVFLKKFLALVSLAAFILSVFISLYIWLPTINPSTYLLFAKTQELFKEGRNHETIEVCEKIIKKDPMFLAAYPLIGEAYKRLGKREEAIKYYFDYAIYSEKKHDNKSLNSAYIEIGWLYQLTGQYPKAFEFYNKAIALAKENKDALNEAAGLRKLAVWYIDKENYNQALELLMKSSEINRGKEFIKAHRYNLACDYFDIGLVFANKEDFKTAREFYQKSQALFKKMKLKEELSDCDFNLGEMYLFEKQYKIALDFYLKGLKKDQLQDNKPNLASDYEMIGELYLEMGNLVEAEFYFKQSVTLAAQINAPLELASASYNLGLLYKQKQNKFKAREYLRKAQEIYSLIDTPTYQRVKQTSLE
ncbi:MAG: CHAT domain-containing protein [Candidatus Omnitrophota bacterium]